MDMNYWKPEIITANLLQHLFDTGIVLTDYIEGVNEKLLYQKKAIKADDIKFIKPKETEANKQKVVQALNFIRKAYLENEEENKMEEALDTNITAEDIGKAIKEIWANDELNIKTGEQYYDYFKDKYNWQYGKDFDKAMFDNGWDIAIDSPDSEDNEDDILIIDGREFKDRYDANNWLNEKLNEYGNTYFFSPEDRATLNALIEKFGNTYFWNR